MSRARLAEFWMRARQSSARGTRQPSKAPKRPITMADTGRISPWEAWERSYQEQHSPQLNYASVSHRGGGKAPRRVSTGKTLSKVAAVTARKNHQLTDELRKENQTLRERIAALQDLLRKSVSEGRKRDVALKKIHDMLKSGETLTLEAFNDVVKPIWHSMSIDEDPIATSVSAEESRGNAANNGHPPRVSPPTPLQQPPPPTPANPKLANYDRLSALRRHCESLDDDDTPQEVLFRFQLANDQKLDLLRQDVAYVRRVAEQLGLLSVQPRALAAAAMEARCRKSHPGALLQQEPRVDRAAFLQYMQTVLPKPSRKRSTPGAFVAYREEILSNFFQCFHTDRQGKTSLVELLLGLILLTRGEKSSKLSFIFFLFNKQLQQNGTDFEESAPLSRQELFLLFRSLLTALFFCCRQSLDAAARGIQSLVEDTADQLCDAVAVFQRQRNRLDAVNVAQFCEWYNERGGFNQAPWLELLDPNKWLMHDSAIPRKKVALPSHSTPPPGLPPGDDQPLIELPRSEEKRASSSRSRRTPATEDKPLRLCFTFSVKNGGYRISISKARVRSFRRLLDASGICRLDPGVACRQICSDNSSQSLSQNSFQSKVQRLLSYNGCGLDFETKWTVSQLLSDMFSAIYPGGLTEPTDVRATELACGFTLLCHGNKSDKLGLAFNLLGHGRRRPGLSRANLVILFRSFLSVLLLVSFSSTLESDSVDDAFVSLEGTFYERSVSNLIHVAGAGAEQAAFLVFGGPAQEQFITYDDFASWYTRVGCQTLPWLELLDLGKWALAPESD